MCWRNEWPHDTEQPPQPFPTSLILWSLLKTFLDFTRILLLKQYPKGEPLPPMLAPCGVLCLSKSHDTGQGKEVARTQVKLGVWGCLSPAQERLPRRPHQQLVMIPLPSSQETWSSLSLRPACRSGCYQKTPFLHYLHFRWFWGQDICLSETEQVNSFQKAMHYRLFLSSGAPKR